MFTYSPIALASGSALAPSVYDYGGDNRTIADGLAVPRASDLVLSAVGDAIDAVVAISDQAMVEWVRVAYRATGLRLEPSAAAAFAGYAPLREKAAAAPDWPNLTNAVHVFWTTGGSRLPDSEFLPLLNSSSAVAIEGGQ